ncbi:hypothetical protein ABFX02_01G070200 [Erythranthe guttata]
MAAAANLAEKPHFHFPEIPPNTHQIPSKSHSNSLCKTLIVLVLLLAIPLFPSQAPDFISQSIFTEFWEIAHLIFVGIAVSYGVFARKTASEKTVKNPTNDDSDSYLPGISHLSSVFEDGFENICVAADEQDSIQRTTDQIVLGEQRSVVKLGTEIRSSDRNGENANREWRSQYVKGESLIVVSNGKYFLGGSSDFKPLNLPVRSLRNDNPQPRNIPETSLENGVKGDGGAAAKVIKIRGVVPTNLQKKLDEAGAAGPSFIPWRSRSLSMEKNGEETSEPFSRRGPHSIGGFDSEHLEFTENDSKNYEAGKGKRAIESSGSDIKSSAAVDNKSLSRAKSVRTIKPSSRHVSMNRKEQFGRRVCRKFGADSSAKRESREENEIPQFENKKRELDGVFFPMPKPKPTISEFDDEGGKQEEFESEIERDSFSDKVSNEDDAGVGKIDDDVEFEGSEVDRKAGEFIAKFREQIRLQKSSSPAQGGRV